MSEKKDFLSNPTIDQLSKRDKEKYLEDSITKADLLKMIQQLQKENEALKLDKELSRNDEEKNKVERQNNESENHKQNALKDKKQDTNKTDKQEIFKQSSLAKEKETKVKESVLNDSAETPKKEKKEVLKQPTKKPKPKLTVWLVVIALAVTAGIGYLLFGRDTYLSDFETVTLGTYQGESIEWIVLDEKEDGSKLLLSKYALDCRKYNKEYTGVTWETCILREYLNNDFYTYVFSSEEQSKIQKTNVVNDDNPTYGTEGGNDTEDYIFLLSIDEINKYLSSGEERECRATEYAKDQGIYIYDGNGNCWYWLRSPGDFADYAANVSGDGRVGEIGHSVVDNNGGVRPAMWVKL